MNYQKDNRFAELNEYLSRYDGQRPGVAVAVIKDHKVEYRKNVGMANLEYQIPITSDTTFNLASVTKPITAMGIMLLKERGELSYGDEIITYFPELSHYCQGVNVKHLLTHTSGIINYYDILRRLGKSDLHFTNQECFELLTKETELVFPPGERFDYSNSGYVLLALLIEKITQQSLDEFLKQNVFKPLGMNNALVYDQRNPIVANRAYGYGANDTGFHCDYIGAMTTGDGCVFASANDLIAFEKALYTEAIVRENAMAEAFTPAKGTDLEYGMGWETKRANDNPREVYHSGGDRGTRCLYITFPDHRLTLIMLANFNEFAGADMRYLRDYVVKHYIES